MFVEQSHALWEAKHLVCQDFRSRVSAKHITILIAIFPDCFAFISILVSESNKETENML